VLRLFGRSYFFKSWDSYKDVLPDEAHTARPNRVGDTLQAGCSLCLTGQCVSHTVLGGPERGWEG
jgi:hypothetical protein